MRPLTPEDLGVWQGGSQSAGGGQGTLCIGHGLLTMASPLLRNFNLTERRHPKRRGNPPLLSKGGGIPSSLLPIAVTTPWRGGGRIRMGIAAVGDRGTANPTGGPNTRPRSAKESANPSRNLYKMGRARAFIAGNCGRSLSRLPPHPTGGGMGQGRHGER